MEITTPLFADAAPLPVVGFDWVLTLASLAALALLLAIAFLALCLHHRHSPHGRAYGQTSAVLLLLMLVFQGGAGAVHENWTHPELLFEAPLSECQAAGLPVEKVGPCDLGYRCPAMADFATARGVLAQEAPCVFCLRGDKLLSLKPVQWHGVKVNLSVEHADPDRVYFYRIHPRYVSAWGG